jgi:hypothetical protein
MESRRQGILLFCEDWSIEEAGTDFKGTLRRFEKHAAFKKYAKTEYDRIEAMLVSILNQPHCGTNPGLSRRYEGQPNARVR